MIEVTLWQVTKKTATLGEKLCVIRKYERNEHTVVIVSAMGIPESTLRTVRKQADKIQESCSSAAKMTASKSTEIRIPIMRRMLPL